MPSASGRAGYAWTFRRAFLGATLRFLAFILVATVLCFMAPNSWGERMTGLIVGLVAGSRWAVSRRFRGFGNRLVVWLISYLGEMALWAAMYREIPSLGALACMDVGFEFVLLIPRRKLNKWAHPSTPRQDEETEAGSSNGG